MTATECTNPECPEMGQCGGKCAEEWAAEIEAAESNS